MLAWGGLGDEPGRLHWAVRGSARPPCLPGLSSDSEPAVLLAAEGPPGSGAGSGACAARAHTRGRTAGAKDLPGLSGAPLSFLSVTSQLACLPIHLPKRDRTLSCY